MFYNACSLWFSGADYNMHIDDNTFACKKAIDCNKLLIMH